MEETVNNSKTTHGLPFTKDDPRINREGRPIESEETKLKRKAVKQIIEEYKQALTEALPLIQPTLIKKAVEGDISAIKEVHDRTMDKAKQPTEISGELKNTIVGINIINPNANKSDSNS